MRVCFGLFCIGASACSGAHWTADAIPQERTEPLVPIAIITSDPVPAPTPAPGPTLQLAASAQPAVPPDRLQKPADSSSAEALPLLTLAREPVRGCSIEPTQALAQGCRPIAVRRVSATAADSDAAKAADGNPCSLWNAGSFAPTTLRLEFVEPRAVRAILLIADQTPAVLEATHFFRLARAGGAQLDFKAHARMKSEVPYIVVLPEAIPASSVEVITTESPSWVAFREIVALECDGLPQLPASDTQISPRRH